MIDYTSFENDDLMVFAEGNGQSFAELIYDAWGMPESPNKLLNNDHGNYVFATFTRHIYDTTLDIYFAEARFYDAGNRIWLAIDPVKDGVNWYQYCCSNPITYWDPTGLWGIVTGTKQALLAGSEIEPALFWRQRDFFQGSWWQNEEDLTTAYKMLLKESKNRDMTIITLAMDYDYFDYFGYRNTRIYTLQALSGEGRTGTYDAATMTTLRNVLLTQYAEFDFEDPELTPDTLKAVRNWYDNSSEIGKKGTYFWENGWGDIITGGLLLGAVCINGPVETISVTEDISESGGNGRSINDIIDNLPETTNGKSVARNFESMGGFEQTIKDFDSLNPIGVKEIQTKYGLGKVGKLSDGTTVVARPGSTTGGATLEIKVSNSKVYKIRY